MKKTLMALMCGLVMAGPLQAEEVKSAPVDLAKQVEGKLVSAFGPRLKVREVAPVASGQMLEVTLIDGTVMHMTPDTNNFIYRDELYQLSATGPVNITQARLNPKRADKLAAVADKDTVFFQAQGEQKALINVFTDIDCGYCQKLHQEIPRLNELGVSVRYLAYPRAGIKSPQTGLLTQSYQKINYVWCQDDRKQAMTSMKTNQRELSLLGRRMSPSAPEATQEQFRAIQAQMGSMLADSKDCGAPIAAQYALGGELGVTGTPAIITQDGQLFPGYMPADDLAARLGIN
ncbi:thioredoxin fold domain-containing protein [Bacterioplanoides sp.]|uniref:thioredoxin fold domain-containing protein n=1 Tax=Bacterioplanoides sp. TaxID=2066072 RepID=UPI003B00E9B5